MQSNRCVLTSYAKGLPTLDNFKNDTIEVSTTLQPGEVLVKVVYISVDPYLRIRLKPTQTSGYFPPFELGKPITSHGIGKVLKSAHDQVQEGDHVTCGMLWQDIQVVKNPTKLDTDVPVDKYMSTLGLTALTAYFGFLDITQPKKGDVVLVSAAAGATGSMVCTIAKIKGCKVIAIAGSDDKCKYLKEELHVDDTINYKTCGSILTAIQEKCPDGIDIYFDNVGGEMLDAAIIALKQFGRISLCGQIASYNEDDPEVGPRLTMNFVSKNAKMEGFIVSRWQDRFGEAQQQLKQWYKDGLLKTSETIRDGPISQVPTTFVEMLTGANLGKMIHHITE